jgi:hypothetical protein
MEAGSGAVANVALEIVPFSGLGPPLPNSLASLTVTSVKSRSNEPDPREFEYVKVVGVSEKLIVACPNPNAAEPNTTPFAV